VSDGYTDRLPDFNRFIDKNGRFQLARFVGFTLLRPASWPALIRMGENSKKAAQQLAVSVQELLQESVGAGSKTRKKS
jgi:adenosylhomocysteine nucleosidase